MSDTPKDAQPQRREEAQKKAGKSRAFWWVSVILVFGVISVFAWRRVGMLNLPSVSSTVDQGQAGLGELSKMKELDRNLWSFTKSGVSVDPPLSKGALAVRHGIYAAQNGSVQGLDEMRQGIRMEPSNLVLANAYRMVVFKLRRDFLAKARRESMAVPHFPPELDRQPVVFFEELDREHASRETKLNLALAWVDEMFFFPAREIRARSSVQAVDILSSVLERDGQSNYVPALYARGLNHLHRPARLVWPESIKAPQDADRKSTRLDSRHI